MVRNIDPDGQFCGQCGARFGDSDSFCAGCGSKRVGAVSHVADDSPFLTSSQINEIVRKLEDSDSAGTFSVSLNMFLFFQGYWLNGDFGKVSISLTNPDHVDVDERLVGLGWEIFEPGEGLDSSYEQEFACNDSNSKAETIRNCLQALALTSISSDDYVSVTLSYQKKGQWIEIEYPVK
jgi:hypothetical protein